MENDLYIAGIIFWCTQKKRPDANDNADANRSKTDIMMSLSGNFNAHFPYSFLFRRKVKIKLYWVIIHSDIGLYIKEFNHDSAKKGAICCA